MIAMANPCVPDRIYRWLTFALPCLRIYLDMKNENPAIQILTDELDAVTQQISDISRGLSQAKNKRKSIEEALSLLLGAPTATPVVERKPDGGPPLADLSVRILRDVGAMAVDDIVNALEVRGRDVKKPSVLSALSRLKRKKTIRKQEDGRWSLTEVEEDVGGPKSETT